MTVRAVKAAPVVEVEVPSVLGKPVWFANAEPDLNEQECISGLLGAGTLVSVYGPSGSGKTFFTLDLALAVARGVDWNGRQVTPGVVLYAGGESRNSVLKRAKAYRIHHFGDGRPEFPLATTPKAIELMAPDTFVPAVSDFARQVQSEWEMPLALIVIDTLARSMVGADENSGQDMGRAIQTADQLREATGATVVLIHHTGKSENGARGHSSLRAALDTEIEVSGADAVRTAKVTKQRDLPVGDTFGFQLKPVRIGENTRTGAAILSCVVEYTAVPPAAKLAWGKNQQKAITALREWARVNESTSIIPSLDMAAILKVQGIGRQRRPEVLNALVNARIISPSTGGHTFDRGAL